MTPSEYAVRRLGSMIARGARDAAGMTLEDLALAVAAGRALRFVVRRTLGDLGVVVERVTAIDPPARAPVLVIAFDESVTARDIAFLNCNDWRSLDELPLDGLSGRPGG